MKKTLYLTLSLLFLFFLSQAQTKSFENVESYAPAALGPIKKGAEVKGYYLCYLTQQVKGKISKLSYNEYTLQILDLDLNITKTVTVKGPLGFYIKDSYATENEFSFTFFNEDLAVRQIAVDSTGSTIGEYKLSEPSMFDKYLPNDKYNNNVGIGSSVFTPIGNIGYGRIDPRSTYGIWGFETESNFYLEVTNKKLDQLWVYQNPKPDFKLNFGQIKYTSDQYIGLFESKKASMSKRTYKHSFTLLDTKTGKVQFEYPLNERVENLPDNVFIDETKGEITIVANYFPSGKNFYSAEPEGIYIITLNLKGSLLSEKKVLWSQLNPLYKSSDNKPLDKKNYTYITFHSMQKSKDGHFVLVGEQLSKTKNRVAVSMQETSRDWVGFGIRTNNMVAIELNADCSPTSYSSFSKRETESIEISYYHAGGEVEFISEQVWAMGHYDYRFTTKEPGTDNCSFVYIDRNKFTDDNETTGTMCGIIKYENGVLTNTKESLNLTSNEFAIKEAKPGYMLISEYLPVPKTIKLRIEKINK